MRLPRWVHRFWAKVTGRFWSQCPNCLQFFGGHEVGVSGPHLNSVQRWSDMGVDGRRYPGVPVWRLICRKCTATGVGCLSHAESGMYHEGCEFAPVPRG